MVFQTVEYDPMCDKENPQKISFEDVSAAAFRIQSGIVKTPCVVSVLIHFFLVLDSLCLCLIDKFCVVLEISYLYKFRNGYLSEEWLPSTHWQVIYFVYHLIRPLWSLYIFVIYACRMYFKLRYRNKFK